MSDIIGGNRPASDADPHWRASMSPLEHRRLMELRKQMLADKAQRLAQLAPPVFRVTAGEPMIGQGNAQVAIGDPVIETPQQASPQRQAMLDALRMKMAQTGGGG